MADQTTAQTVTGLVEAKVTSQVTKVAGGVTKHPWRTYALLAGLVAALAVSLYFNVR